MRNRPALDGVVAPCLPSLAARPPSGAGWIHEIKQDGFRLMARRDAAGVRLITRNGNDWSARYPAVLEAVWQLKARSCLVDGEVIVADENGVASFDALRHGSQVKRDALLYAFDLLELDGRNLRREPLEARKAALARLIGRAGPGLQLAEHIEGDGAVIFAHACRLGCEGIVSKRLGSTYRSGRSLDWVKTKNPDHPAARRVMEEEWR